MAWWGANPTAYPEVGRQDLNPLAVPRLDVTRAISAAKRSSHRQNCNVTFCHTAESDLSTVSCAGVTFLKQPTWKRTFATRTPTKTPASSRRSLPPSPLFTPLPTLPQKTHLTTNYRRIYDLYLLNAYSPSNFYVEVTSHTPFCCAGFNLSSVVCSYR